MKVETKFIIDGSNVIEVVEVDDEHLVPADMIIKKADRPLFESRLDARYHCMLKELQNGKDITNYRSSKYYKYYVERLKEDHPEYVI